MEMYNRTYKESSITTRGQLTYATVARYSQMFAVAESINKAFEDSRKVKRKHGNFDHLTAVDKLSCTSSITNYKPWWFHISFPDTVHIATPNDLKGLVRE